MDPPHAKGRATCRQPEYRSRSHASSIPAWIAVCGSVLRSLGQFAYSEMNRKPRCRALPTDVAYLGMTARDGNTSALRTE